MMSLKQKMLALYVGVSILILVLVGAILTARYGQIQRDALERELLNQLQHIDFALSSFITEAQNDVKTLASNEIVSTPDAQDFTNFLEADEDTFVYNIGETEHQIIDVFNAYRTSHPYVNSVYMGRENGSFVRSHERASPTQYDPRTRPWYILGKENPGSVMRTEPYPSVTTTDVNLGIVTALVDERGEVYGVVGADITLVNLADYISGFEIGHQGHILLVDEYGTILVSREQQHRFEQADILLGDQSQELMSGNQGLLVFTYDGESNHLFFFTSLTLGWKIAAVIPSSQISQDIRNAVFPTLLSLFLALALVSALTFIGLNLSVIRPLTKLSKTTHDITETGNLGEKVKIKSSDEIGSLATSFNQMIGGIQHTQEALEKERDLANALKDATISLTDTLDVEIILDRILEQVSLVIPNEACNVMLIDNEQIRAVRWMGYGKYGAGEYIKNTVFSLSETATFRQMASTKKPIVIPDTKDDPDWQTNPKMGWLRSFVAAPIIVRNQVIGFLNLDSSVPDFFQKARLHSLEAFASHAGAAIENARLYQQVKDHTRNLEARIEAATKEIRQRADELAVLYELSQAITSTLDLDTILQTITDRAAKLVDADKSLILLIDEEKKKLVKSVGVGYTKDQLESHTFEEFLAGINGWILKEKKPTSSTDLKSDSRIKGIALDATLASEVKSAAIAPLLVGQNMIGTLAVINNRDKPAFDQNDINLITRLASLAAVSIHNAQLYEAAQEADQLKSAFLASMSHELRTPLNSIIGFTGILLQGLVGPLNEEQNKQMRMVQNSAHHLLALINDVLDISKIEAGQLKIERQPVSIQESIQEVINTVQPLADKKGLRLVSEVEPGLGPIISDQRRVEQILINLINNAIKFTDEGEVRIRSEMRKNQIVTSVTDTGIGIKADDQEKLFKTFQQIDTGLSRKHEGTGLGLSISKKLVEMLGGTIRVESQWGVGSTFSFSLPVKPAQNGDLK